MHSPVPRPTGSVGDRVRVATEQDRSRHLPRVPPPGHRPCGDNMVVLGGGVDRDTLSQWTVALLSAGDAEGNFTINAICATAPSGYAVRINTRTSVEPLSAQVLSAKEPNNYQIIAEKETVAAATDSKVKRQPTAVHGS